jgi:hypothetical protein
MSVVLGAAPLDPAAAGADPGVAVTPGDVPAPATAPAVGVPPAPVPDVPLEVPPICPTQADAPITPRTSKEDKVVPRAAARSCLNMRASSKGGTSPERTRSSAGQKVLWTGGASRKRSVGRVAWAPAIVSLLCSRRNVPPSSQPLLEFRRPVDGGRRGRSRRLQPQVGNLEDGHGRMRDGRRKRAASRRVRRCATADHPGGGLARGSPDDPVRDSHDRPAARKRRGSSGPVRSSQGSLHRLAKRRHDLRFVHASRRAWVVHAHADDSRVDRGARADGPGREAQTLDSRESRLRRESEVGKPRGGPDLRHRTRRGHSLPEAARGRRYPRRSRRR